MADLERVKVWAHALIRMHLHEDEWSFGFDNAKRRAGLCNYTQKRITVSRYLAAKFEDDEIHQILIHEIAHAIAGPDAGHGARWKRIARDIGYVGGRTHNGDIARELAPWAGICPSGHEHVRFRRPTAVTSCALCARGFSPKHVISWQRRDTPQAGHPSTSK